MANPLGVFALGLGAMDGPGPQGGAAGIKAQYKKTPSKTEALIPLWQLSYPFSSLPSRRQSTHNRAGSMRSRLCSIKKNFQSLADQYEDKYPIIYG